MKTRVDIVSGFLNSGKTTYINIFLRSIDLSKEKIIVVQFEKGKASLEYDANSHEVSLIHRNRSENLAEPTWLEEIINEYQPSRLIVEYNGMNELESFFSLFEQKNIRKKCGLGSILCLVDALTFEIYMHNFGNILRHQIASADTIIINKATDMSSKQYSRLKKGIKNINRNAEIFKVPIHDAPTLSQLKTDVEDGRPNKTNLVIYMYLLMCLFYFAFSLTRDVSLHTIPMNIDFSGLLSFSTIFVGVLYQAFPFMLVGLFVSSVLHVFVSNERVVSFFPKKFGIGFLTALFGGLLFPVCECAIVPVTTRLVKKGVPLPVAITFMLSAPIVNPIVIASTLYAFPGHPEMLIYRLAFGLVIALSVGLLLTRFQSMEAVLLDDVGGAVCDCIYCKLEQEISVTPIQKVRRTFLHAGEEFFYAGKYLILGAAVNAVMQVAVPRNFFVGLWQRDHLSLLVMMAMAFVLSVCSTSDAFIARSFADRFSTVSIIGFLVFGPMMDIKNLFMLFASYKKIFVFKLVMVITVIAFLVMSAFAFLVI